MGPFENATIHVLYGQDVQECVITSENYVSPGKLRTLSDSKQIHLEQMSKDFIPSDRHLPFVNIA